MKNKEIILTPEELEEIKDNERFKIKTVLLLKQLNGIPQKVWKLETWMTILRIIVIMILGGLLGVAWRVLAK